MWRDAGVGPDTNVGIRRTEIDRCELSMNIGEMQKRDLPNRIKLQKVILR